MEARILTSLIAAVFALSASVAHAQSSPGSQGPQRLGAEELQKRTLERRAVETVIWGMPAVNFQLMLEAFVSQGGGPNQVVYWSQPVNWKDQTLTPNPDTIYLTPFYDTTKGPVVLEIPPAGEGTITGSIDNAWQNALEDVGPAGADKGKGGKYLILPPGYKDKVPEGYIPLRSSTFRGFALLRSNLKSRDDKDIAEAVAYGKRIKFYPLPSGKGGATETRFVDAYDKPYEATIPYEARFFDALDRFVQVEPWLERDRAMIDTLATLGIVKGKARSASAGNNALLDKAAQETDALLHLWMEKTLAAEPFNKGSHWALPVSQDLIKGLSNDFPDTGSYPVDSRGVMYSLAYFSAKHLGVGQFYLMTTRDSAGNPLEGGKNYRLRVPANPPVNLYWSVTAYDGATHGLIRDMRWASRGSNTTGLKKNADGSVDVFFGPSAPTGGESNWVPTNPHGRFELLFRLYGPEKPFFDKVWKLPDLELQK